MVYCLSPLGGEQREEERRRGERKVGEEIRGIKYIASDSKEHFYRGVSGEHEEFSDLGEYLSSLSSNQVSKFIVDKLREKGYVLPIKNIIDIIIDREKRTILVNAWYREILIEYEGMERKRIEIYGQRVQNPKLIKVIQR